MKKLNGKLMISAMLAAAVLATSAISASAADYTVEPDYAAVEAQETAIVSDPEAGASAAKATPVLTEAAVEAAIAAATASNEATVTIFAKESVNDSKVVIQEAALEAIKESGKTVTLQVAPSAKAPENAVKYAVTIDPALISSDVDYSKLDFGMNITAANAADDAADELVEAGDIVIAPNMDGEFGLTLTVTIPASATKDLDPAKAALYHDDEKGNITKEPDGALTFGANGNVAITISHSSRYIISNEDVTTRASGSVEAGTDTKQPVQTAEDTSKTPATIDNGTANNNDSNPTTGVAIAVGSLAVFAAAAVATSKKRK